MYECVKRRKTQSLCHTLELRLLDEAALVLVQDVEDIFDLFGCLGGQTTGREELCVGERVWGWTLEQQQHKS